MLDDRVSFSRNSKVICFATTSRPCLMTHPAFNPMGKIHKRITFTKVAYVSTIYYHTLYQAPILCKWC